MSAKVALIIKIEVEAIAWFQALQAAKRQAVLVTKDTLWVVFIESQHSQN